MIKIIIFDTDGVIVHRAMNFSERYSKEFGIPLDEVAKFYHNEFQLCLVGKADLKTEIVKYLPSWGWTSSVDELLQYWFSNESSIDEQMVQSVVALKKQNIRCYMNTNNEKHRSDYLWHTMNLSNLFDGLFSSGYLGFKKPQQEFWNVIYEKIGKPDKSEVLVLDNEQENIDSARQFGYNAELFENYQQYENLIQSF